MMKRIVPLSLLVLSLWADVASGQPFTSEDLHRPLIPARLPQLEVYTATFTGLDELKLEKHLILLNDRRFYFRVKGRDEWGQGFDIATLMEAVNTLKEDPYAWHLLGAYYALGHELAAATEANWEALRRMELLREELLKREGGDKTANRFLGDLELRCRANLARLLTAQDRPRDALDVLGESLPKDANSIVRHTLITAGILAFLEAGEIEAAGELIAQGEGEEPTGRRNTTDERLYPQFGSPRWEEQTLPYLRARRHYTAEDYNHAVKGLSPFGETKFWEARFLLGLAWWKAGELERGIDVLKRLWADLPKAKRGRPKGKLQRPELLLYNLGLLHEQRNEGSHPELDNYRKALELTIERDCRIFTEMRRVDDAVKCNLKRVCESLEKQAGFLAEEFGMREVAPGCRQDCNRISGSQELAATPAERILCQALAFEPFSAAFNNLGLYYLRRAREAKEFLKNSNAATNIPPDVLLGKAERALEAGLVGADTAQHWRLRLNLVLVELERSAFEAAVLESRRAAEESPAHKEELAALLSDALRRDEGFRRTETALFLFLDLANQLAATEMPDYLTSVLAPIASGTPGWTHVPVVLRDRAAALLQPPR